MSLLKAEFGWPGGDRPGSLEFCFRPPTPVIDAIAEALAPSFPPAQGPKASYQALCPLEEPVGRYRISTSDGSWFVRVCSRSGNPGLEKSITQYLFDKGVNVNRLLLAGVTLNWEGRTFRIDVRPFIEGRHFDGSPSDLLSLTTALSSCHTALEDFPWIQEVRAVASTRYRRLAEVRDLVAESVNRGSFGLFAEQASWASAHRKWLGEMVERFELKFDELSDAQCVHGEIHPGNVLFRKRDGVAVLVDFEESVHLFMPPTWDLAFLVQRFCLRDDPPLSVALERLAIVEAAYRKPLPPLALMMRQAAWFTVATIVGLRISGVITPVSEYDKFVELERQARAFEGLI